MNITYMLDTNICSYIMRERPFKVLNTLQSKVFNKDRIVVSAITYSELKFGSIGKKASSKMPILVDDFISRVDAVMPWDKSAVDETTHIKKVLNSRGTPISNNDAAIAGNAIALKCILVTNNIREFKRIDKLRIENWSE